uniref:Osteopetrosis-associated transmembrane protein 1 n=1 Tax=Strigamia maritima TaxID=126957 RepID=T1IHX1_STRMM
MVNRTLNLNFTPVYILLQCALALANYTDLFSYDLKFVEDDQRFNSCHILLETYAAASANFTKCLILNAKPISVCRKCEIQRRNAFEAYDVIQVPYTEVGRVRRRAAQCRPLAECFFRFNLTAVESNKACEKCNVTYKKLKTQYKSLLEEYEFANLCMDVIDSMNITRKTWNEFNCILIHNDVFVLFTVIAFLCLTPVVFYLSNWISSEEVKSRIVPQKRLVATRSHAHLSSVNFDN